MSRLAFTSVAILSLAACSSGGATSGTTTGGPSGPTITMDGMSFSPSNLDVAAGATITVVNNDTLSAHTVTSEAVAAAYVKAQVDGGFTFDTGALMSGATATISVPAGLASGLVMPYFCEIHMATMNPPNPTITIK
jgi:plastocyanin